MARHLFPIAYRRSYTGKIIEIGWYEHEPTEEIIERDARGIAEYTGLTVDGWTIPNDGKGNITDRKFGAGTRIVRDQQPPREV